MKIELICLSLLPVALLAVSTAFGQAIEIPTVLVSDAGNPTDSTGYGQVNYDYYIGIHEVTNGQYAAFFE